MVLLVAFILSGHYNKILSVQYLINRRNLFFAVPEASKSKTDRFRVMCSPAFRFTGSCLLTVSSHVGRGRKVVWALFIRALTPLTRPLSL